MSMDEQLRAQVQSDADSAKFHELAIRQGMRPLRLSGAEKVHSGLTTPEEVFGVLPNEEL